MTDEGLDKAEFSLHVVFAADLCARLQPELLPNAYIDIEVDNFTARTKAVQNTGSPVWREVFKFTSSTSSTLSLRATHETSSGPTVLGTVKILISELLELGRNRQHVTLKLNTNQDGSEINVRLWKEGTTGGTVARSGISATNTMEAVVSRLKVLAEVADENTKIYPCANLVWCTSSSVYKVVKDQLDSDQQIIDLIASVESVYSFTDQLHDLENIGVINNTIIATIQQTFECLIFLREYAGRGFAERGLKEIFPTDAISRIQSFTQKFAQLKSDLDADIEKQRDFVSCRVVEQNDSTEIEKTLQKLQPMNMHTCDRPECLPGTRSDLLKFVAEWATSPLKEGGNILLLFGVAGSGKSTLSTTIASFFQKMRRLGAHIFFDRSVATQNTPSSVIRTLAYQLGSFDHRIGLAIAVAIDSWPDIVRNPLRLQLQKLLIEPLAKLNILQFEGPIVVVLDALDECGSAPDRNDLLRVLAEESAKLPFILRFVITSRPEYDIRDYFDSRSHILIRQLDITSEDTRRDIEVFLRCQLSQMLPQWRDLPKMFARDSIIRTLVQQADGLFVWATNACKFICKFDPDERLPVVWESDISSDAAAALDTMYITALESAAASQNANFSDDFRAIIETIHVARGPLSATGLKDLLHLNDHTILRLGSVLYGDTVVRILHPSFVDFLTSQTRCKNKAWLIDPKSQHLHVANHCLERLGGYLRQNVCDLGYPSDINKTLPEDIVYACCFWAEHVCSVEDPMSITDKLETFLFTHLLHWFEAMSILKRARETIRMLKHLHDWYNITGPEGNSRLQNFIGDACQFVQIFIRSIEEHPLHVYMNALPSLADTENASKYGRRYFQQPADNHGYLSVSGDNPRLHIREMSENKYTKDRYISDSMNASTMSANQSPSETSLTLPRGRQTQRRARSEPPAETSASENRRRPSPSSKVMDSLPRLVKQPAYPDPFFRHLTVLPTINATLYEALIMNLPPCSSPLEYIHAEANHVNGIVRALWKLTKKDDIYHASFPGDDMIYRRLILYIFAHLMFCTNNKGLLNQFKGAIQHWKTWGAVTIIQNHQTIKEHLQNMFQQGLQSIPSVHAEEAFSNLVAVDTIALSSQLTAVVTDNNKYKEVLAQRGRGAQSLLDVLQARLDFYLDQQYKPRHIKALHKLSRASGLYPRCFALQGVEIESHPVAQGGYGDVYKGRLHGQVIAVKALRMYQASDLVKLLKEFSSEAVLWRQLCHPNVLPFYGIYHWDNTMTRVCLTSPWMENGHVADFVRRNPGTYCVHLALDIALGLEHLHSLKPSIIHGDLKGANVLITRSGRAALADFGVASAIDSKTIAMTHNSSTNTGGTVRWQAPELHNPEGSHRNNKATDIYAFACVCYEMFAGEIPFHDDSYDMRVVLGVMQGKRPIRPTNDASRARGLSDEMWELIETCWKHEPTHRPTAAQVVECLQMLPNQPIDQRPSDDFIPPKRLYSHREHPFSALLAFEYTT